MISHAYVVLALDVEVLRDFAKQHLAAFAIPRQITKLDGLPRNTVGEIVKRELRLRR